MVKTIATTTVYEVPSVVGRHCIFELQDGNPTLLNDEDFVKTALIEASDAAGATLLQVVTHKFEPQGVTGFALLAESHISIHTYPEHHFASIDAFTCGEHTDPEAACRSLKAAFQSSHGAMRLLNRDFTPNRALLQAACP
jgi:S-adenosylmethionine decarboxylase